MPIRLLGPQKTASFGRASMTSLSSRLIPSTVTTQRTRNRLLMENLKNQRSGILVRLLLLGPPLLHLTDIFPDAYFTKLTEGQLKTIDDIEELRNLVVPEGMFRSARTSKAGKKGESSRTTSSTKRQYAPFPSRSQPPQPSSSSQASTSTLPPPPPVPVASVSHEPPQPGPPTSGAFQYPPDLQHYQQPQPQQYPQAQGYPHAAQYTQAAQYQQQPVGWPGTVPPPPPAPSDRAPQYSIPAELQPPVSGHAYETFNFPYPPPAL